MSRALKNLWQAEGGVANPKRGARADGTGVVAFSLAWRNEQGETCFLPCELVSASIAQLDEWEAEATSGRFVEVDASWVTKEVTRHGVVVKSPPVAIVHRIHFDPRPAPRANAETANAS